MNTIKKKIRPWIKIQVSDVILEYRNIYVIFEFIVVPFNFEINYYLFMNISKILN